MSHHAPRALPYSSATALVRKPPRSSAPWPQWASHVALGRPVDAGTHWLATQWKRPSPHSAWQSSRGRPLALGTHASFTQAKGEPQTGSVQLVHLHQVTELQTDRV